MSSAKAAYDQTSCSICLDDLDRNIKQLSCKHQFHAKCINEWIKRQRTCPMCKTPVPLSTKEVVHQLLKPSLFKCYIFSVLTGGSMYILTTYKWHQLFISD